MHAQRRECWSEPWPEPWPSWEPWGMINSARYGDTKSWSEKNCMLRKAAGSGNSWKIANLSLMWVGSSSMPGFSRSSRVAAGFVCRKGESLIIQGQYGGNESNGLRKHSVGTTVSIAVPSCTGNVVQCSCCVLGLPQHAQCRRFTSTKRLHPKLCWP